NSGEADISLTVIKDGQPFVLFNPREVAHLRDVKALIWLDYRIALITLAYALAYAGYSLFQRRHRRLARAVLWGSGLTLGLMLALGVGALADFGPLFWQFHLISFSNDFWQLDPARDYLIMMFPGGFWQDAVLFIVLAAVAGAVILGGAAAGHLKFRRGWARR
ncbi:MAG: TIGR01906 family membrane protein, partial [Chloroflexota bacterium]